VPRQWRQTTRGERHAPTPGRDKKLYGTVLRFLDILDSHAQRHGAKPEIALKYGSNAIAGLRSAAKYFDYLQHRLQKFTRNP
jgi:hypothetical protein